MPASVLLLHVNHLGQLTCQPAMLYTGVKSLRVNGMAELRTSPIKMQWNDGDDLGTRQTRKFMCLLAEERPIAYCT